MIKTPMDVLEQHPVRKRRAQKKAFRADVVEYAAGLGYLTRIESDFLCGNNVVIGEPETAKYLITAHYDTCARLLIPNLITPCNVGLYWCLQLGIVAGIALTAILASVVMALLWPVGAVSAGGIAETIYWVILLLMIAGPANPHNANDNTSGVVTVLEIAQRLPLEQRKNVAFVLFDLEEAGLIGSSSYQKKHKKETQGQIILNLDCVGDGEELVMFPTKKLRKDQEKMALLRACGNSAGERTLVLWEKSKSIYPSDQVKFPYGVGIAALRKNRWGVGYCSRIHTARDTVLEEENLRFLADSLINFLKNNHNNCVEETK